jgi:hypothetical protein
MTSLRLLAAVLVVVALLAGGWVTGGVISNDFTVSMILTALWVGALGLVCLLVVRARREMWPMLAAFAVAAAAAGIYLAANTFIDEEVDEDVVTAKAPAEKAPARERAAERPEPPSNVLLARGRFASLEHPTSGVAQAIETRGGKRVVTLTDFETDNGPDLRVYLSSADAGQNSAGDDFEDLGSLKGNKGNQQYEIPRGVDLDRLSKVVIWCRAFSVGFGQAPLRGA